MEIKKNTFAAATLIASLGLAGQSSALSVAGSTGALQVDRLSGHVQVDPLPSSIQVTGGTANATGPAFDIQLNYINTPSASEAAAFASAEATWESLITNYKEAYPNSSVIINVNLGVIDGAGGILGSAGPTNGFALPNYFYTSQGSMTFDTADIPGLGSAFETVVLHEMGHVLGIGTLWSASTATGNAVLGRQELYVNGSGQYTGANGLAAYNSEFSQAGAFVPVELGGGSGTANGHWNEVDGDVGNTGIVSNIEPGPFNDFRHELMTGWLNPNSNFISTLTVQGMQDLGYDVVPEPSSLALLGLGGLLVARRRRG